MEYDTKKQMMWLIGGLIIAIVLLIVFVVFGGWNLFVQLVFNKLKAAFHVI